MRISAKAAPPVALPALERCPVAGCHHVMPHGRRMCAGHWAEVSSTTKSMLRSYGTMLIAAKDDKEKLHLAQQWDGYWQAALREAGGPLDG
ncbi:MAG: hypothetical protein AAF903_12155 [Pseudomonadota bacterium]